MYLEYEDYRDMGGMKMNENIFEALEKRAEKDINYMTFNRLAKLDKLPEDIKYLVKELIDLTKKKMDSLTLGENEDSVPGPFITNQSNDGVSVSYANMTANNLFYICETEVRRLIQHYLADVVDYKGRPILYRGIYPGE